MKILNLRKTGRWSGRQMVLWSVFRTGQQHKKSKPMQQSEII